MKLAAVILAGGKSARMGQDKARLQLDGRLLIERQIEVVWRLGPSELFISVGERDDCHAAMNLPLLNDSFPQQGPLAGIESALATMKSDALLVLAVDLPRMREETLRWLIQSATAATGAVPRVGGVAEPLAAVYPKAAHALLRAALAANRNAARGFAAECVGAGLARWMEVPAERQRDFINCNTPEDWAGVAGAGRP